MVRHRPRRPSCSRPPIAEVVRQDADRRRTENEAVPAQPCDAGSGRRRTPGSQEPIRDRAPRVRTVVAAGVGGPRLRHRGRHTDRSGEPAPRLRSSRQGGKARSSSALRRAPLCLLTFVRSRCPPRARRRRARSRIDGHGIAGLPTRDRTIDHGRGRTDGTHAADARSARRVAIGARRLPEWLPQPIRRAAGSPTRRSEQHRYQWS